MADPRTDGRVRRGLESRQAILERALDVASLEGLESLSVRRLAAELELSKSGVFAQFGSKEELQLATVRAAVEVFTGRVVKPARRAPAGIRRVYALCEAFLRYAEGPVLPGGCFFISVAAEVDARPGRVRDAVAAARHDWRTLYERTITEAVGLGELRADVDPPRLAFELDALTRTGAEDALLHDDPARYAHTRAVVRDRLRSLATDSAPALD